MLYRVIETEVLPISRQLGIGQIVWSPIAQGVLAGKYRPGDAPPAGSRATGPEGGFMRAFMRDDVLAAVQRLRPVADALGVTMAQLAIAWVLRDEAVSSAIVGASRTEQVDENVAASGVALDQATLRAIDEALASAVYA
jgi:aryl-alcohol dehydrogenase-like predicted oxidoreductase